MGFSRQAYWSGLPYPTLGALPDPRIETSSPSSRAFAGQFFTAVPSGSQKEPVSNIVTDFITR